jgi:hypothetical protein
MTMDITLPAAAFRSLLLDLSHAADDEDRVKMLSGVLLYTADLKGTTVLVGSASNRYLAAQGHVAVNSGQPGVRMWLTRKQITQISTLTRFYVGKRSVPAEVSITLNDGVFSFRVLALDGFGAISVDVPAVENTDFPSVSKLLAKVPGPSVEPVSIAPRWLTRLIRMCHDDRENLVIETHGSGKPVKVTIGDRLWAIVMPVRLGDSGFGAPIFDLPADPTVELAA